MAKILVVDDIVTNRALLRQTLVALNNYEVIEAVSGNEAIDKFEKEKPDLILMDIMMPDTDGCQATTIIKEMMGDDYTPIIFVTALSSDDSLAAALESGGDDFISKPFNVDVLASKISAHLRIRELNQQLNVKNNLLLSLNQRLMNEQELIEHFFERAIQQSFLDKKIIRYHMSSLSAFNGDILLTERAPHGGLYLIMGDFSGHGLTAAMGTLPVAMIFFKMAAESASVGDIAEEINNQLYKLMPPSMFFAASIIELNSRGDIMTVWMGGVPDSYWLNKEGKLKGIIHAQHMPLGIHDAHEFDASSQVFNTDIEDKIYLYSDGITEARNASGEMFGDSRLKDILLNSGDNRFENILSELKKFSGEENQDDDTTLVELTCHAISAVKKSSSNDIVNKELDWKLSVSLTAEDMRSDAPIAKLVTILNAMPLVSRHKGVLQILLTEIYANSLDHGILKIESKNKVDEDQFTEYYNIRNEKLKNLKDAYITFDFSFYTKDEHINLGIHVTDSGDGYHKEELKSAEELLHGRGLSIIRSFCENVAISEDGKTLELLYNLS